MLPAQPVSRAAEEVQRIHPLRTFQGFKLADHFPVAAFLQRSGDRAFEFMHVHRFGQAVVRAARALQRLQLLLHLERAGDDDDGHMRQQFLERGQKTQTQLTRGQNVVEQQ
ncbi:MAG: hypothetical protein BWX84_02436 [Verrucomicrobia bacterium ADurb.Bin118]|nr:MAG: hypothetical protein BWX84_02436 [Verrucomicrobia bacterium ADurb.Bin118]